MDSNKLKWLRGPLPPISESILMSGLVNEAPHSNSSDVNHSNNINNINNNINNITNNNNNQQTKNIFQSAPVAVSKPIKRPLKLAALPKPRGDQQYLYKKKVFLTLNQPVIEKPEINASYKPPSLDENTLTFKKTTNTTEFPISENLTEKVLSNTNKHSNLKDFIEDIERELDSNISSVVPISPDAISPEEQTYLKTMFISFHNFAFNRIILKEKTLSSYKAAFLRRLLKFYNSISTEFPPIISELQNIRDSLIEEINTHKETIEKLSTTIQNLEQKNTENDNEIHNLKESLEKVTNESNNKDILASSASYDLEILKSQTNQLQFQFNMKCEEKKSLENVLLQRDIEIKGQLCQIEDMTKQIAEFQQGETGYIVMFHQEKAKNKELTEDIENLKKKIYDLENIEKNSIAVDTTDLPVKKGKKKKLQMQNGVFPSMANIEDPFSNKPKTILASNTMSLMNPSSALNQLSQFNQPMSQIGHQVSNGSLRRNASRSRLSASASRNEFNIVAFGTKETQTDESNIDSTIKKLEICEPIDLLALLLASEQNKNEYNQNNENELGNSNSIDRINFESKDTSVEQIPCFPTTSLTDDPELNKRISEVPDLHKFIMPFFSDIYIAPSPMDMKILSQDKVQTIIKNEKPLIWGLQLIHNFMTDPYVRSIENKSRISNEVIIVDWLAKQYKLQHLVNQAIADFVRILNRYRHTDEMIRLFCEIIEGNFNLSQLCFLVTVYSFSCSLTTPNLVEQFQNFDLSDSNQQNVRIHLHAVNRVYAVCFSQEIANNITSKSLNSDSISYVKFLKDITNYFGDKHHQVSNQARDLLTICGCTDPRIILYDVFESVMVMLGNGQNIKADWKLILNKKEDRTATNITLTDLLGICADREKPLINLLGIIPLKNAIISLKTFSQVLYDLYRDFINRFSKILPHVMSLLSDPIKEKIAGLMSDLKIAILTVNMQSIIWTYRQLLSKIDRLTMKEKGFIPLNLQSNSDTISQLKEYIERSESVAFALIAKD